MASTAGRGEKEGAGAGGGDGVRGREAGEGGERGRGRGGRREGERERGREGEREREREKDVWRKGVCEDASGLQAGTLAIVIHQNVIMHDMESGEGGYGRIVQAPAPSLGKMSLPPIWKIVPSISSRMLCLSDASTLRAEVP